MAENFPNVVKEMDIQIQETQSVSSKMNPKSPTLRHIIITMWNIKYNGILLKGAWEKQLVHKGITVRQSVVFLAETL